MPNGVLVRRPTRGVRQGLRLILDKLEEDFDRGFDRIFPGITEREIMALMEAAEWLEQYAADEVQP